MNLATVPLVTGSPATATNRTNSQRSKPAARNMESHIMYPGSINIAHIHADERRKDMLAEAHYERQVQLAVGANRGRGRASAVRNQLGIALVSLGQRLQHTPAYAAPDQRAPLGSLGSAR